MGIDFQSENSREDKKTNLLELRFDPSFICSQVSRKASFLPVGRGFGDGMTLGAFHLLALLPITAVPSHPAPLRWSSEGWREVRMPVGGGRQGEVPTGDT